MRIYQSFKEMLSEVRRDVAELGIRCISDSVQNIQKVGEEYEMKELLGYSYELTNTMDYGSSFTSREIRWLIKEFGERINLAKINPGEAWKLRREVWEPLMNEGGKFDYTYNERIRTQLPIIINELRKRPNTRQAVMTIYSPQYHADLSFLGGCRRIPCSLSYQFLLRKDILGKACLNLIYNMRSCDVMTHFKFDAALACMLINHVSYQIGRKRGSLIHNVGSLHIFRKDIERIF